jgi:hypothetical protein
MAFGFVMDVPAPVEFYDALHAEIKRRVSGPVDGLLLHVGRATAEGFQVIEVWESREQADRYDREVVLPVLAQLSDGQPAQPPPPRAEFEPRGLVVPSAELMV